MLNIKVRGEANMRRKNGQELHILMGLPGSGKTTYANFCKYARRNYMGEIVSDKSNLLDIAPLNSDSEYNSRVAIIDLDAVFQKYGENLRNKDGQITSTTLGRVIYEWYHKDSIQHYSSKDIVILDGLILNHHECKLMIDTFLFGRISNDFSKINKVVIDFWTPNIDNCLWNDKGRRTKNSDITIRNSKLTRPNIGVLREEYGSELEIQFVQHDVVRKEGYRIFVDSVKSVPVIGDKFYSDTWCLGGESWGWDGSKRSISPEQQPTEFKEFDTVLMEICPNITFLQYKKLYALSVSIEDLVDSDYYSRTHSARFVCDMKKLGEGLIELGLVK